MEHKPDDLIYIPSNTRHRIENTGSVENEFYFVRPDAWSDPGASSEYREINAPDTITIAEIHVVSPIGTPK